MHVQFLVLKPGKVFSYLFRMKFEVEPFEVGPQRYHVHLGGKYTFGVVTNINIHRNILVSIVCMDELS